MVKIAYERWSFTRNSNNYYKALTKAASKSLNWPASRPWPYTHFGNEIGFFQEVLWKNHLLCVKYLGFDWCGWLVLIKSQNSHYNGNGLASQFWQIVSAIRKFWCFWLVVANERWSHMKVWLFIKLLKLWCNEVYLLFWLVHMAVVFWSIHHLVSSCATGLRQRSEEIPLLVLLWIFCKKVFNENWYYKCLIGGSYGLYRRVSRIFLATNQSKV